MLLFMMKNGVYQFMMISKFCKYFDELGSDFYQEFLIESLCTFSCGSYAGNYLSYLCYLVHWQNSAGQLYSARGTAIGSLAFHL